MFKMDVDLLICSLWDTLRETIPEGQRIREYLDDGSIVSPGLLTSLDLGLSYHDNAFTLSKRVMVYTLFTGNTSVFVATSPLSVRREELPMTAWLNTSNHDSCWRSDGMDEIKRVYFDMADELNDELLEKGLGKKIAPMDFHQWCSLGWLARKPWEWVDARRKRSDSERYTHELVSITRKEA